MFGGSPLVRAGLLCWSGHAAAASRLGSRRLLCSGAVFELHAAQAAPDRDAGALLSAGSFPARSAGVRQMAVFVAFGVPLAAAAPGLPGGAPIRWRLSPNVIDPADPAVPSPRGTPIICSVHVRISKPPGSADRPFRRVGSQEPVTPASLPLSGRTTGGYACGLPGGSTTYRDRYPPDGPTPRAFTMPCLAARTFPSFSGPAYQTR
jgi:hypothetical protein